MKRSELLSPAGNFECLKAAVNNGADAVYLGGKNFSARAFANNFDEEELVLAIRYAHLRGVKVYVTLNTLLNENELQNALKMADFYYRNNVDALLIQDLGLFYVLKERYPDFDLHCSTQMHVHNVSGVDTARKLGFARVVLARESDIDLIRQACNRGIEVETFVHGAICVSYSGQCLMSSFSKKRSANKGMCAQCCRLRYDLLDKDLHRIKTDTDYLISPKDMYLIEDIPDLIEAGVSCFKIEGRMKSSAYVGYVTGLYRRAIDSYYEGKKFTVSDKELHDLKVLFSRGFTSDLLHDRKDLFGQKTPNHLGIEIGEALYTRSGMTYIRLTDDLNQFDGIRIGESGCIVNMLYKDGLLVNGAGKGDTVAIKSDEKLSGKVYKTIDHLLENRVAQTPDKKMPLDLKVMIVPDEKARVRLSCKGTEYIYESELVPQKALKQPLDEEMLRKQFGRLNETVYYLNEFEADSKDAFMSLKELNELRRTAVAAFDEYRLSSFKRTAIPRETAYLDPVYPEDRFDAVLDNGVLKAGDREYSFEYPINADSVFPETDNCVISEFGGLLKEYKDKMAYYTLNCSNSYAYEFLKRLGFSRIVLSTELNSLDINSLISAYKTRNGKDIHPYVLKKGRRVLMYIKTNPFDRYMLSSQAYYLDDGKNLYVIRKRHGMTEILEPDGDHPDVSAENCLSLTIIDR